MLGGDPAARSHRVEQFTALILTCYAEQFLDNCTYIGESRIKTDGIIHSNISHEVVSLRATTNNYLLM